MPNKDLKDWTAEDLTTYCTWQVMEHIIKGNLKDGVLIAMETAMKWKAAKGGK